MFGTGNKEQDRERGKREREQHIKDDDAQKELFRLREGNERKKEGAFEKKMQIERRKAFYESAARARVDGE